MAFPDTRIHQIELLLTLDYLLNHTDEFNPATQIDICEHARKYGLKFDKNAKTGNQVRRQRISECLKFLREVTEEYTEDVPFVLETTDSGKYYVEQKHGLNENQVAKVLAAISNDKYTKDEDVTFLVDRILSAFSTSEENRRIIDSEYKRLLRGGKRCDRETIRKINLIEKAYREGKMIKIKFNDVDTNNNKTVDYFFWYRVYLIKEFHNKPYAFMFPIKRINFNENNDRLVSLSGYLFEPIENIDVVNDTQKNVLCDDFDEYRDFDELFREKCPNLAKRYDTIDKMLEKSILPNGGKACIVSFYFNLGLKDILRRSFEEFFSESFRYQETNKIVGIENQIKDYVGSMDNWQIVTEEPKKNEHPKYGLVNISVDNNSFKSWLLSDPYSDGNVCIADMITIIKPLSLNEDLAQYYFEKLLERVDHLTSGSPQILMAALNQVETQIKHDPNDVIAKLEEAYNKKQNLHLIGPDYETGKTVRRWYEKNKDRVNGYYLDGPLLKVFFDETISINGHNVKGQILASNEIDNIASYPNRVIVINDYQFMDENAKEHISLLEEGFVVDSREEKGYKRLENISFVCVIEDKEQVKEMRR